jgi:hypothetical protein
MRHRLEPRQTRGSRLLLSHVDWTSEALVAKRVGVGVETVRRLIAGETPDLELACRIWTTLEIPVVAFARDD